MHLIMSGFYGDLILLVGGAKLFDTQLPYWQGKSECLHSFDEHFEPLLVEWVIYPVVS